MNKASRDEVETHRWDAKHLKNMGEGDYFVLLLGCGWSDGNS